MNPKARSDWLPIRLLLIGLSLLVIGTAAVASPLVYREDDGNWQVRFEDARISAEDGRLEILYQSLPMREQPNVAALAPNVSLATWDPASGRTDTRRIVTAEGLDSEIWQSEAVLAGDAVAWRVANELRFLNRNGEGRGSRVLAEHGSAVRGLDGTDDGGVVVATTLPGSGERRTSRLLVRRLDGAGGERWRIRYGEEGVNHILQDIWSTADDGAVFVTEARDPDGRVLHDRDADPSDQTVRAEVRAVRIDAAGRLAWETLLAVNKQPAEGKDWDRALMQIEAAGALWFSQTPEGAAYLLFERSSTLNARRGYFLRQLDRASTRARDVALEAVEENLDIRDVHSFAAHPDGRLAIAGILRTKQAPRGAGFVALLSADGDLQRAHLVGQERVQRLQTVGFAGDRILAVGLTTKIPFQFVLASFPADAATYEEPAQQRAEERAAQRGREERERYRQQLTEQAESAIAEAFGVDPKAFAEMSRDKRKAVARQQANALQRRADDQFAGAFGMSREEFSALSEEEKQRAFSEIGSGEMSALVRQSRELQADMKAPLNELAARMQQRGGMPEVPEQKSREVTGLPEGVEAWSVPDPAGGVFEHENSGDDPLTLVLRNQAIDEALLEKQYPAGADIYEYFDLSRIDARLQDVRVEIRDASGEVVHRYQPVVGDG